MSSPDDHFYPLRDLADFAARYQANGLSRLLPHKLPFRVIPEILMGVMILQTHTFFVSLRLARMGVVSRAELRKQHHLPSSPLQKFTHPNSVLGQSAPNVFPSITLGQDLREAVRDALR